MHTLWKLSFISLLFVTGCGTFHSELSGPERPSSALAAQSGAKTPIVQTVTKSSLASSAPRISKKYTSVSTRASLTPADVLALQGNLAALGYLPLQDQNGQLLWRYAGTPASLKALWKPGVYNAMTKGAVMSFQADHGLAVDGIFGPKTSDALSLAVEANEQNTKGYSYIYVNKSSPETLTLWRNGRVSLKSLVNTGVAGADTPIGTWPIYQRYVSQEMRGTNPNGSYYDDPGVLYVNYFDGGDAVHGFVRNTYGFPQSAGCVEMPVDKAKQLYGKVSYGTLVTITS